MPLLSAHPIIELLPLAHTGLKHHVCIQVSPITHGPYWSGSDWCPHCRPCILNSVLWSYQYQKLAFLRQVSSALHLSVVELLCVQWELNYMVLYSNIVTVPLYVKLPSIYQSSFCLLERIQDPGTKKVHTTQTPYMVQCFKCITSTLHAVLSFSEVNL